MRVQVGTWNDGINFTAPLSQTNSAVVFANKTLRVTTILVRIRTRWAKETGPLYVFQVI